MTSSDSAMILVGETPRPLGWRLVAGAVLACLLLAAGVGPATAAGGSLGQWHRNNYNTAHERLTCREGATSWTCAYESDVPIAVTAGTFSGRNVTASWSCPNWFPSTICDNVVAVYEGIAVYRNGRNVATVREDYVVTNVGGLPVLQQYFIGQFACPWYRTYDQALANDFNCVFAP